MRLCNLAKVRLTEPTRSALGESIFCRMESPRLWGGMGVSYDPPKKELYRRAIEQGKPVFSTTYIPRRRRPSSRSTRSLPAVARAAAQRVEAVALTFKSNAVHSKHKSSTSYQGLSPTGELSSQRERNSPSIATYHSIGRRLGVVDQSVATISEAPG